MDGAPMLNREQLFILHRIPGRVRLGGEPLRGEPARAERIALEVRRIEGVTGARANPHAASLVIEYDERAPLAEILQRLTSSTELAALGFGRIERERPRLVKGAPGRAKSPAHTVESILRTASRLNSASSSVTPPHLDLKLIVPGALFGYGIFRLLTSRFGPTPHWIVFLMYGLDAFSVLNQSTIRRFFDTTAGAPRGGSAPS
jgi:hypothetical protein